MGLQNIPEDKHQIPNTGLTYISSEVVYDTNCAYLYPDSKMHYFPMSMRYLVETEIVTGTTPDTWAYYKVDLISSSGYSDYCYNYEIADYYLMPVGSAIYESQTPDQWALVDSGGTVLSTEVYISGLTWEHCSGPIYYSRTSVGDTQLNNYSFYVYNKPKCDKYGKWQLFWLNPHGGFDNYTFNAKTEINYKIEKQTFKQRYPVGTPTTFDPYFGGEKVFDTISTEEITLRTDLLTQKESQLLIQMIQSPVTYLVKQYKYDPSLADYTYALPYLIVTKEIKYEQKINDKEIVMEIVVRAANKKIIQSY